MHFDVADRNAFRVQGNRIPVDDADLRITTCSWKRAQPMMGGYQLMISTDIFRGRYRESLERPRAITPNEPLNHRFALPTADHVFQPGHRLMVQVQSSWFPLYDRNPQTFVRSIFLAKPGDYRKAVQRVWRSPADSSFIRLPLPSASMAAAICS